MPQLPVPSPKEGWRSFDVVKYPKWVQTNLEVIWTVVCAQAVILLLLTFAVLVLILKV